MIKNIKFFLFLSLFNVILISPSKSENVSIAFVDVQKILSESNSGKKFQKLISDKVNKNLKIVKKEEKDLKSQESEILKKKNILSKDELDNKIKKFQKAVQTFRKKKKKFDTDISKERSKFVNKMFEYLNKILANYASEKSISLIVQKKNILIGKSELDITKDILKIFNDQVKLKN
jgi:outer membrane protein